MVECRSRIRDHSPSYSVFLCLLFQSSSLLPAESPRVPAYQRFHQQGTQPVEAGSLLLGELNCTSCHEVSDAWAERLPVKTAPVLDQVGSRVRPQFIAAMLKDPQSAKPGTTMPDLLGHLQGLTAPEAYMLCSVCADLRISEIVDQPNWVVSLFFPKIVFE